MGTTGATFVRFGFGFPFALIFVAMLNRSSDTSCRRPTRPSSAGPWLAALSQIVATSCSSTFLVPQLRRRHRLFAHRAGAGRGIRPGVPGREGDARRRRRDRDQRRRRHADFGRAYRRRLALAAVVDGQPQCADRAGLGNAVRHFGGRLPRRVAGARRAELHDAGSGDACLRHLVPDRDHVRLDDLEGVAPRSAVSPAPGSRRSSSVCRRRRRRSAGSRR